MPPELDDDPITFEGPREDIYSVDAYNERHWRDILAYLRWTYGRDSIQGHYAYLRERPYLCKSVIENHNTPDDQKWSTVTQALGARRAAARIVYVVGDIDSGKTTIAYDLAHDASVYGGRPVVALGEPSTLPDFVGEAASINDAPRGSIIIMDEAGMTANARDAMTKDAKARQGTLATIRHGDKVLITIAQNTAMVDPNFARLASMFVFKQPGMTSGKMDRNVLRGIFRDWRELMPRSQEETFVLSKKLPPMKFRRQAPEWYTQAISESYRPYATLEEVMDAATTYRRRGKSWPEVARRVAQRWEMRSPEWWRTNLKEWNGGRDPIDDAPAWVAGAPQA